MSRTVRVACARRSPGTVSPHGAVADVTPGQQLASLAELARTPLPRDTAPTPIVLVRLVAAAKERGATWAVIAAAVGAPDGRAAKRWAKTLASQAQKRLLAREGAVAQVQEMMGP